MSVSDDVLRADVAGGCALSCLRQEENQSVAVPGELARELPKELLDMIGNTTNGALGYSEEYMGEIGALDQTPGEAVVEMNE